MKTKKLGKKLTLNKITVTDLNVVEMNDAKGGTDKTSPYICISRWACSIPDYICETRLFCSTPFCETDINVCF